MYSNISPTRNTLLPSSIIESSPSYKDKITNIVENQHRVFACELIQEGGILLRLPQVAMISGQTICHHFYYRKSIKEFDAFIVAMASIFLASKIEEEPKRIRDVLNVFNRMYQKRRDLPLYSLTEERFVLWRDRLIITEQNILLSMGFCIYTLMEHPHKFVLYYVKVLEGTADLAQKAWNYLNDSYRISICTRYEAKSIACAAIYLAARHSEFTLPENPPWWDLFEVSKEEITLICNEILQIYQQKTFKWIDPLLSEDPYVIEDHERLRVSNEENNHVIDKTEEYKSNNEDIDKIPKSANEIAEEISKKILSQEQNNKKRHSRSRSRSVGHNRNHEVSRRTSKENESNKRKNRNESRYRSSSREKRRRRFRSTSRSRSRSRSRHRYRNRSRRDSRSRSRGR